VVFGGDTKLCNSLIPQLNRLFLQPGGVQANEVDSVCRQLSIDALVVKDTDRVWRDRDGWVWKKAPYIANDYARVFLCGGGHLHALALTPSSP